MRNEVQVHTDLPLTNFLCGQMPIISSNRNLLKNKKHDYSFDNDRFDFSIFPPEIVGLRPHKSKTRPSSVTRKREKTNVNQKTEREKVPILKQYKKLKEDETLVKELSSDLSTYSDSHKRKTIQIHQDWEERYMKPFLSKMNHKLNGQQYENFVSTRNETLTSITSSTNYSRSTYSSMFEYTELKKTKKDKNNKNESESESETLTTACSLPYVRVPLSSCEDRIHKYQKRSATESRLAQFIQNNQEVEISEEEENMIKRQKEKKEFGMRNTLDLEACRVRPETRFFYPGNEPNLRKGRRPFKGIMKSTIETQLNQF